MILKIKIRSNINFNSDNLVLKAYQLFNENKFSESLEKLLAAENYFNGHLTNPTNVKSAAAFFNLKDLIISALMKPNKPANVLSEP